MLVASLVAIAVAASPQVLVGITFDVTHKPSTKAVASVNTANGDETQVADYARTFTTLQSAVDADNGILFLADIIMGELNLFNLSSSRFLPQKVQVDGDGCDGNGFCFFDFGFDPTTRMIVGVGVGFNNTEVCLVSIDPTTGKVGLLHKMKAPQLQTCGYLQESGSFDPIKRDYYGVFSCVVNGTMSVDLTMAINLATSEERILLQTNMRLTPFPSIFASGVGLLSHVNDSLVKISESGSISVVAKDLGGSPERHGSVICAPDPTRPIFYSIIVNGAKHSLLAVDLLNGGKKTVFPLSENTILTELSCVPPGTGSAGGGYL
jgi:hypothetical protein